MKSSKAPQLKSELKKASKPDPDYRNEFHLDITKKNPGVC